MLGVRLEAQLEAQLTAVAHARGVTKSDVARDAIRRHVNALDEAYRAECRRQSLVAAGLPKSDDDRFWDELADDTWNDGYPAADRGA